jgi:TonB family protein
MMREFIAYRFGHNMMRIYGAGFIFFLACVLGFGPFVSCVAAQISGPIAGPQENNAGPMRIRVAANVPRATLQTPTTYPQAGMDQRVEGDVILHLIINRDGTVKEASTLSGPALLADSAIEAVKQWQYKPVRLNGSAVEVDTTVTLSYVLGPPAAVTVKGQPLSTFSPVEREPQKVAASSQPPYDRLELLASMSANMYRPCLIEKIRARGVGFALDATFREAATHANGAPDVMKALVESKRSEISGSAEQYKAYLIQSEAMPFRTMSAGREKIEAALALAPKSAALHMAYAGALLVASDYPRAEAQERLSLQLWQGDADAHVGLAAALTGQGRDDEAIPEAREALQLCPNHKAALVELGMALTRDRQYKDAVPVLHEAISRTPEMPLLHKHLGLSLFNTGDIEGAISEDMLYLKNSPNDAEAHYNLGIAFRAQGRKDDALAQFREAARLEPSSALYSAVVDPSAANNGPQSANGQSPDDGSVSRNTYTNRFFGFSLEFPEDWVVMGAEAQRNLAKVGGEMLAGGDQTLADAQQAGAAHAYQLLFVTAGHSGQSFNTRSIQISALDLAVAPEITSGEDYLKSSAKILLRLHSPLQASGVPTEISMNGNILWRMDITTRINENLSYGSEIVAIQKGYLLLFTLSSPDQAGLESLLQDMKSLRFSVNSN